MNLRDLVARWRSEDRNFADPAADMVIAAKHKCADELETQLRTAASEGGEEPAFFVPDALVKTCKMLHPTVKLHRVTVATERTETHTLPLYTRVAAGIPVAWTRTDAICDEDGRPIGTDEPTVSWGSEPPDEEGWFPLYDYPPEVARDAGR